MADLGTGKWTGETESRVPWIPVITGDSGGGGENNPLSSSSPLSSDCLSPTSYAKPPMSVRI